jgi:hypothetical protein
MFQAIEEFQDDFDFIRDGDVNPKGQTARKINEVVEHKIEFYSQTGSRSRQPSLCGLRKYYRLNLRRFRPVLLKMTYRASS